MKYDGNPVLGGALGTCFDVSVLRLTTTYRMWFSWRPKRSIAWTDSTDGIHWSEPAIALAPLPATGWELEVNRPAVVYSNGLYRMWYTGQTATASAIGYAESTDGAHWERILPDPVLTPLPNWERPAVMAPGVLWDEAEHLYKMWYSGGQQYEPNAIGYATSPDGIRWTRASVQPVLRPELSRRWERNRVAGAQVIKLDGRYCAFYIGFETIHDAAIGLAVSKDGIHEWKRHPANPIIRRGSSGWDRSSCYKPYAIFDGSRWLLWYNGRDGNLEQIGLAIHQGEDLGLPSID
ncbi:MAG: hypothetical protein JO061_15455 [Acidobacteriaceae bacterium]|nr:hypothetical protein [Acidobacteriaceae bacterium]